MAAVMPAGLAVDSACVVPGGRRAKPLAQRVTGRLALTGEERNRLAAAPPPPGVTDLAVSEDGVSFTADASSPPWRVLEALLGPERAAEAAVVRTDVLFEGEGT